jgi:hypothetical protein
MSDPQDLSEEAILTLLDIAATTTAADEPPPQRDLTEDEMVIVVKRMQAAADPNASNLSDEQFTKVIERMPRAAAAMTEDETAIERTRGSAQTINQAISPECIATVLKLHEPEWLLAHLLLNDVVFLNTHWSEKEWPAEARDGMIILINCNDCFGPYADCERVKLAEIETLYRLWQRDSNFGPLAWVIAKRKMCTWVHKRIDERMAARGWDVEALVRGQLP